MSKIGCTSPFGSAPNHSNICTDPEKAKKTYDIFDKFAYKNLTAKREKCPKSCTTIVTNIGSYTETDKNADDYKDYYYGNFYDDHDYDTGYLKIRFQRSVKISRSRVTYGLLELLAEVGGYVGLFLGVSINQLSSVMNRGCNFIFKKNIS